MILQEWNEALVHIEKTIKTYKWKTTYVKTVACVEAAGDRVWIFRLKYPNRFTTVTIR
jgi:hypothetical protein